MKVNVKYEKCIGCGDCYALCPQVFTLDDNGIAQVKTPLPTFNTTIKTQVTQAKNVCPTGAITIEKD